MPLDPNIALSVQPMRIEPQANALARILQLQGGMQQNALRAMQMQDMQQQRAAQTQQATAMREIAAGLPDAPPDAPPQVQAYIRGVKSGAIPFNMGELQKVMAPPERKLINVAPEHSVIDERTGQPVYTAPAAAAKPEKAPNAVQEYEYAKGQGYTGSFDQWKKEQARAGAPNTSVSYGAPVAGMDADGKPVFFQPDKKGGNPAIVPGVRPPAAPVPSTTREKMAENSIALSKIDAALKLLDKSPGSVGLQNVVGDTIMQRADPAGVELRAAVADIGSQKIHDRSGAAVTASEAPRLKPFVPLVTDTTETVRTKLKRFKTEYAAMQQALQSGASIAQAADRRAGEPAGQSGDIHSQADAILKGK